MMKLASIFLAVSIAAFGRQVESNTHVVRKSQVLEFALRSSCDYAEPFSQVEVDVHVKGRNGKTLIIPAFWAGDDVWRVRFSSPDVGDFSYVTRCSDKSNSGLHNQAGTITIRPYRGDNPLYAHGPVRVNRKGQYLEHSDGTPFFWLADSWWHGMTKRFRWPEDFKALTQDRKAKGFSVIQFAIGFPCDIHEFDERGANEAGFPMTEEYRSINPAYFDLVDLRIAHLVDEGLVPNILGTWGYYLPWMGVDKMKQYWRYLIARYSAYPVTWTVAGESTLTWYLADDGERDKLRKVQRDGWSEVARYIKATDPYRRIITVHPGPSSGRFRPITEMSALDMIMVQPGHRGWETIPVAVRHVKKAMTLFPDRPVMQGEVCFEGMFGGSGPKVQRILFWTNMLSGAVGHCYGADGIWQFNTQRQPFGKSPGGYVWGNTPWEAAHKWSGSTYVGMGRKILTQFQWWRFRPFPQWVEPCAADSDALEAYAAGIPGEIRIFYFPRGVMPWRTRYKLKYLDVDSTYDAKYIDPMTGEIHPIEERITRTKEWEVPPGPILQDWVLILEVANTDKGES
jgi:hypothetical protein